MRGEDDHRQARIGRLDFLEERHAIHAIHAQVGEDEVGARGGDGGERALAVLHRGDVVAVRLQADGEQAQQVRVVVDEEEGSFPLLGHQRLRIGRSERLFSSSVSASSFCCRASARCFCVS